MATGEKASATRLPIDLGAAAPRHRHPIGMGGRSKRPRAGWRCRPCSIPSHAEWSVDRCAAMTTELVTGALVMAIWRRGRPKELPHQSTREAFQRLLAEQRLTWSDEVHPEAADLHANLAALTEPTWVVCSTPDK